MEPECEDSKVGIEGEVCRVGRGFGDFGEEGEVFATDGCVVGLYAV